MSVRPIIHCLVEREPRSFHAGDVDGKTLTFSVNLSLEVQAHGELVDDEKEAEDLFQSFFSQLPSVRFWSWHYNPLTGLNNPELLDQVSDAPVDPNAFHGWLVERKAFAEGDRFWTTAEDNDPDAAVDASRTTAFFNSHAVSSWNAPIGHRIGVTHLVRFPTGKDGNLIVLPYFADPTEPPQFDRLVGAQADFYYRPDAQFPSFARTTIFEPWKTRDPLDPNGPTPIVDPDIDLNGFLRLDTDADALSRYLANFEAKAASLLAATTGLISPDSNLDALEARIGIRNTGTNTVPIYDWGGAVWYTMARLVGALDPWIISLMQPGKVPNDVGGDVLAPLAVTILDALDGMRTPNTPIPDYEPRHIHAAIRAVLAARSALVRGRLVNDPEALSHALRHVFGISPALTNADANKTAVADQPAGALVSLLLDAYHSNPGTGVADSRSYAFLGALKQPAAEILSVALTDLEQQLHDEAGAERALVRIFEACEFASSAPPDSPGTFASELAEALAALSTGGVAAPVLAPAITEGWRAYRDLLDGPYNGAEAVRRAAAAAATRELLAVASKPLKVGDLEKLVGEADYHRRRFEGEDGSRYLDFIAKCLVVPAGRPAPPDFTSELEATYGFAAASIDLSANGRFIPDTFPRPLPIQTASGIDADGLDQFAHTFNGICVAIRRLDADEASWAYANLADLIWRPTANARLIPGALHPVLPAVTDGRGTMFLSYEGVPFADQPDPGALGEGMQHDVAVPFYAVSLHDFDHGGAFELLPTLAYGRNFQSFSFAVTNAGTAPLGLQLDPKTPWMPREDIAPLADGTGTDQNGKPWEPPTILEYECSRRTAIAQTAIQEVRSPQSPARFGQAITAVYPLCKDYPRIGLVASTRGNGAIDLFRDSDGVGRMEFPKDATTGPRWVLDGLIASGKTGTLHLRIFDRPADGPDDTGNTEFKLPEISQAYSCLELSLADEPVPVGAAIGTEPVRHLRLVVDGVEFGSKIIPFGERWCWLRLVLENGPSDAVSTSFVDPDGHRPAGKATPLLLLAPDTTDIWTPGLSNQVEERVQTPRVGFADFARWMANIDLAKVAGAGVTDESFGDFLFLLTLANRLRHLEPKLGPYLDTLPDPAVQKIVLELQATDSLTKMQGTPATLTHDVPSVGTWLAKWLVKNALPSKLATPEVLIEQLLKPLSDDFSYSIAFGPGRDLSLEESQPGAYVASVPAGHVARYGMFALVAEGHFKPQGKHPAVIHEGLQQYAVRRMGGYMGFDAGARQIEAMYDGVTELTHDDNQIAIDLASTMIAARPVPDTRRYDLVSAETIVPELRDYWRLIAEVDVTTQRWRPSGRPIYHHIAPRQHAAKRYRESPHPALPLLPIADTDQTSFVEIERFEREAFFDRPDSDAHTITQRLEPLPTSTVLQEFPWDPVGATYCRHRLTLRTRYAGALRDNLVATAWRNEAKDLPTRSHVWPMRVAMLADKSRLTLTRPQLRGLIPLTVAPSGDERGQIAPPIAAVLQEPPFSRGGLADRVASEIHTGFGYGFDQDQHQDDHGFKTVKIQDSRKEIGPNPQLDYRPLDADSARSLGLRGEGPLGLTFDSIDSSAPALPNSMMMLRPFSFDGDEPPLQEALLGVAMRRYIDPEWLAGVPEFSDSSARARSLPDITRCWWIEFDDLGGKLSYSKGGDGRLTDILQIVPAGELLSVKVWKGPIDSGVGAGDDPVEIGRFHVSKGSKPTILHQQITAGNFLVSLLVQPESSRTDGGETNVPVTLCSFEWSLPRETNHAPSDVADRAPVQLELEAFGHKITVWETMASGPTPVRWTQINRNFDYLNVLGRDTDDTRPGATPLRADLLKAKISANESVEFSTSGNEKSARLCASTTGNPYPVHVHRHLAMISSSFFKELGRPVEKFRRAALSVGPMARFTEMLKTSENALRVIEFETPAAIVCAKNVAAPPMYKSAYFDLISSGYAKDEALLLSLRFVGSTDHLSSFAGLGLRLSQPGLDETTISHTIDTRRSPVSLYALVRGGQVQSWIVYDTGESVAAKPVLSTLRLDLSVPGFFLDVVTPDESPEFWADVSLLHGAIATSADNAGTAIGFDFNWLFSPEAAGEPASLVLPRALTEMVEAQARIVSVSPPIPIVAN
ncbi:hypothetical protein [Mesorhizobium sp. M0589]|uniref:hypothetical protein n=1 Tax=Mesorhizobium sp. M0589 TaxID=2956965 RepID=UPI00333CD1FC